jgi:outer membrane lipoprotein SlyB
VLNEVVESGRLTTPAELVYSLTAIQDMNGSWVNIDTYEIRQVKGSHTDREVAMIGGGAIVGGIIGKVIDKKGSTEIGAVAGAAAGAATAAASGKKDIVQSAGTGAVFYTSMPKQIVMR